MTMKVGSFAMCGLFRRATPLFNEEWKHYCGQILKGTTEGAIKGVRAMLVLGEGVTEEDVIVKKLVGFYEFTKAHAYRVVDESNASRDHV
jgi:hypothetical protein